MQEANELDNQENRDLLQQALNEVRNMRALAEQFPPFAQQDETEEGATAPSAPYRVIYNAAAASYVGGNKVKQD